MFEEPIPNAPITMEVLLDGQRVKIPENRRSINAIKTYLETLVLERERVLCSFIVAGHREDFSRSTGSTAKFACCRIEAQSFGLSDMPLRMLHTALQETIQLRVKAGDVVALAIINEAGVAREIWWELAGRLKEPLLTLALLPETTYQTPAGSASLLQMRKWQLQQLALLLRDVDELSWQADSTKLSDAIENIVLPWLGKLHQLILLWFETMLAGTRARTSWDRDVEGFAGKMGLAA